MRGSIRKRYTDSWNIIIDLGYQPDPQTGKLKRKQKWFTVRGTKRDAEKKLAELLHQANRNELVEPTKLTLGQWLDEWLETAIKPPNRRQGTYATYTDIIRLHLGPALGMLRVQSMQPTDLQRYYTEKASSLAPRTLAKHHAILHSALKAAQQHGLVLRNVASLVLNKPKRRLPTDDVRQNCWDAHEAKRFLVVVQSNDLQSAAFYTLALDSGARRGELLGLRWADVDLTIGSLTIAQQLVQNGMPPHFGPPKTGRPRTLSLTTRTIELLRHHKAHQSELKLANRTVYHDYGLVFAREWRHTIRSSHVLGLPLSVSHIADKHFRRLMAQADVRPITFHGLRHTSATLLLQAGVPVHVVQARLGHTSVTMTLEIYAHALPSMHQEATQKLAKLLGL